MRRWHLWEVGAAGAVALAVWGAPMAAGAVEAVGVGPSVDLTSWTAARESCQYVGVHSDSIWMPAVAANANVASRLAERGGGVYRVDDHGLATFVPSAAAMFDGEGSTAYDPDEVEGVGRLDTLLIDLGAAYRANRVRMLPRLDLAHRNRFLQEFELRYWATGELTTGLRGSSAVPGFTFTTTRNTEPAVERRFDSVTMRYLALLPTASREWEVAELEVYGDGTVPVGEYVSRVLAARRVAPAWGRVLVDGEELSAAPFTVQTRTGPTVSPLLYYVLHGDEVVPASRVEWEGTEEELRGPVAPDPAWSGWETVSGGLIRSPSLNRYLQFRVRLPQGGTALRSLVFEYSYPPIAHELLAEVSPAVAEPGAETSFVLSVLVYLKTKGSTATVDSGFREMRVATNAEVLQVDSVRVDDRRVLATTMYPREGGFTTRLWERVTQNGTFLQVFLRAQVYLDATRFEVQMVDRRTGEEGVETAYQQAEEADVDAGLPGEGLVVRLAGEAQDIPVLGQVHTASRVVTPNGDGVRDELEVTVSLLKLVSKARVELTVRRIDGCTVHASEADLGAGLHTLAWDGRNAAGRLVLPGLYLYRVQVQTEGAREAHTGTVSVVY